MRMFRALTARSGILDISSFGCKKSERRFKCVVFDTFLASLSETESGMETFEEDAVISITFLLTSRSEGWNGLATCAKSSLHVCHVRFYSGHARQDGRSSENLLKNQA
ncbi:hypothetical protein Y032_0073g741 [Ancylostoma ceylanicum]|uniref:Uncharacterized protein n=1 Tax=Ancylostoma ceylanicum TaxID=53326 RepID=A0A016TW40_9BILA|nr:hypothetical protein Y032_0073g741 [Ancylostoma ceylanicum]